jgi:hypothetical protein
MRYMSLSKVPYTYFSDPMKKEAGTPEPFVAIYQSTRRHTSEDTTLPLYTFRPSVESFWVEVQKP